jgi:hypothetical protein
MRIVNRPKQFSANSTRNLRALARSSKARRRAIFLRDSFFQKLIVAVSAIRHLAGIPPFRQSSMISGMNLRVRAWAKNLQIRQPVVSAMPIFVMHNLIFTQLPPKRFANNGDVLKHVAIALRVRMKGVMDQNVSIFDHAASLPCGRVFLRVFSSMIRVFAGSRAIVISSLSRPRGVSLKRSSTLFAFQVDHGLNNTTFIDMPHFHEPNWRRFVQ